MPDIHIRNVDAELLRKVNIRSAVDSMTQREWLIQAIGLACGHLAQCSPAADPESFDRVGVISFSTPEDAQKAALLVHKVTDNFEHYAENPPHDSKTCRVYRCTLCMAQGKKF